jgi:hypothetical protein
MYTELEASGAHETVEGTRRLASLTDYIDERAMGMI